MAKGLIKINLKEPLNFHIENLKNNKINIKKSRIRNILYTLREESFPKEEEFLKAINNIKIKLSNNELITEENYCIAKGEIINFKNNNKLEKYVIFSSDFQLNLFIEINELFIDATFKICPPNWYQLLNIFGYIEKRKFYLPMGHILMNSKSENLYNTVFTVLIKQIKSHCNLKSFSGIKIMSDFELPMRKSIKNCFDGCLLEGCFFHYCRSIWKKIKKLNLYKKSYRKNTLILSFILKSYPFIKNDKRDEYCDKIESFCNTLKGNYIKLNKYSDSKNIFRIKKILFNYIKKYLKNYTIIFS